MNEREKILNHRRIVIKVGSTTLAHESGKINLRRIEEISRVLTDLRNQGKEVILVSSGAIAVGFDRLGMAERPRDVRGKQTASAVGQAVLMQIYQNFFMSYNQKVAQILLTRDVLLDTQRREHARNTFSSLLELGVIPIVNENDVVSTEELGFSENDILSAHVACLMESDLLLILSDTDGLYDTAPENPNARLIAYVEAIDEKLEAMAGGSSSGLGTGGMTAKLTAAKLAFESGVDMVIASGKNPSVVFDVLEGKVVGTYFCAPRSAPAGRFCEVTGVPAND